ncbi:F420-dependent oxidoreductase [Streptomyces sp. WM6372]|uniref:LLM class F420-dependent oxidoreductase n=1 Tax=Streptomyces sp. WM6372 TaxID=1415555 RepID=UPI0006B05EA1|nr:LLM class F420-dependent oxidoreductase [Streptomyces sp. WM6372]KOU18272.1 F420-dependent oxidoreductase [Streptomyces sp. WM6372]
MRTRTEFRIFVEPQEGASYETQLRFARAAEELGFSGFFRSDHYLRMGRGDGLPGPTDAWTTLAGLARETERIRLGTLMTSATFRLPGVLAVLVAQVDAMSGGRIELGLGAGWYEEEHSAYGIPFPERRFDRLEEQLAVITGIWATPPGGAFDFAGEHYRLTDCPGLPKPVQARMPVIIGGTGARRTPALAARYATEFNVPFVSVERTRQLGDRARAAAAAIGRPAGDLLCSNAVFTCVGRDGGEFARRAERTGRDVAALRADGLVGSPAEVVERIGRFQEAGSRRFYLQLADLDDLDHLELIASQVVPQLG